MWENLGSGVRVANGDCLEVMRDIPDKCVDMVLADPPYGTTACKWDSVIPFEPMWEALRRVTKPRAAIVMTASQPFTSALVMSNPKMFKWEDIWHKSQATGHLNAKIMPMREHENIVVFGNGRIAYNPQLQPKPAANIRPVGRRARSDCYGKFNETAERSIPVDTSYPRSVIRVNNTNHGERGFHPTQKPVALMEYLIKTYTNENDVVLDFTMGSGTTGVACVNLNRRFIGIEKDASYYEIAKKRITEAQTK